MTVRNAVAPAFSYEDPSYENPTVREEAVSLATINTCFGATDEWARQIVSGMAEAEIPALCELSVRALNVLKLLAAEITGETPTRKDWAPSNSFLQRLTYERLLNARNCGPLTIKEIVQWAELRGISIAPRGCTGKSFAEMWRYLEARFSAGELAPAEMAEALERSVRRRNTKIPAVVQRILLKLLNEAT